MTIIKSTHSIKLLHTDNGDFEIWVHGQLTTTCTTEDLALEVYSAAYNREYCSNMY